MADVSDIVKDAAYVGIGFGVLSFQRAQVRRQELTKRLNGVLADVEVNVDRALDDVETRLPEPARDVLVAARSLAKDAAVQLRTGAA